MKWLVMQLLGAIFVALIACSIQSVSADHESSEGIFKDKSEVNLVTTQDSDYQVYLQAVLRNGDGQLINVTENTKTAAYIPHEIADYVFDTLMGEKEIVTIDNIKYEKVQWTNSGGYTPDERNKKTKEYSIWKIGSCADFSDIGHGKHQCISIFQVLLPTITLELGDVATQDWTILRELGV